MRSVFSSSPLPPLAAARQSLQKCNSNKSLQTLTAYTYHLSSSYVRHLSCHVVASVISSSHTQKYFIIRFLFNDLNRENT